MDADLKKFREKLIEIVTAKDWCKAENIPTDETMLLFGKMCYSLGRLDGLKETSNKLREQINKIRKQISTIKNGLY